MIHINSNQYLHSIIRSYLLNEADREKILNTIKLLYRIIKAWNNQFVISVIPSGSFIKGTAIKGGNVDVDLMISLNNKMPFTLKEAYNSLYNYLEHNYYPKNKMFQ